MTTESNDDTSRTVVKTYLPAYQRDEWDAHAEDLEMSRSEFVKAMVQAGRRGFDGEAPPTDNTREQSLEEPNKATATDDDSLEEAVLEALADGEYRSWDELLAAVTDDIESRLEETLQELQADDEIRYSGRHGGYTLEP